MITTFADFVARLDVVTPPSRKHIIDTVNEGNNVVELFLSDDYLFVVINGEQHIVSSCYKYNEGLVVVAD